MIARPALRWFGGKWRLAPWIIARLPPHHAYVEPFCGGLSVLLNKEPSRVEVANDLYGDVVDFFRVLRERPGDLIRAIKRTPYAKGEVTLAKSGLANRAECEVERARQFFVLSWQTYGGPAILSTGFRVEFRPQSRSTHSLAIDWSRVHKSLPAIARRLRGVVFDVAPAARILAKYDDPETLHYVDPPYLAESRSRTCRYRHEMSKSSEHVALIEQLLRLRGMVALSGYRTSLYDEALVGWQRHEVESQSQNGARRECLWLNPAAVAAQAGADGQLELQLHGASA